MKRLLLLLFFPSLCQAGEFVQKTEGVYEYTGVMIPSDVAAYKALFKGKPIEVVVDSGGGYLSVGIELADYTREFNHLVRLTAKQCYSAAALWVAADPDFRYADKDSFLAFHLPYYAGGYAPTEADWMFAGYRIGACLDRSIGAKKADQLMFNMVKQRDKHGVNGYVVWSQGEPERLGKWSWDPEGWAWDTDPELSRSKPPIKNGALIGF